MYQRRKQPPIAWYSMGRSEDTACLKKAEKKSLEQLKRLDLTVDVVPVKGIEPSTFALQVRCSTN
jgi:hypothetical protein